MQESMHKSTGSHRVNREKPPDKTQRRDTTVTSDSSSFIKLRRIFPICGREKRAGSTQEIPESVTQIYGANCHEGKRL
jgi:hypothetical protein